MFKEKEHVTVDTSAELSKLKDLRDLMVSEKMITDTIVQLN